MNERIKALWVEATGSIWPNPGKFTAGEYDYHLEKFAELIVKDCLQFVGNTNDSGDIDDLALGAAELEIKNHFGMS